MELSNQMCFSLKNLSLSAINFYKCILENEDKSIAQLVKTPNVNELFEIIEAQFDALHNPDILVGLLNILRLTIEQSSFSACASMSHFIKRILGQHTLNEQDYLIALQLLKQFLTSLPAYFPIDNELIDEIIKPNENANVHSQLAICIFLLVDKFQKIELLEIIWDEILKKKSHSLLVHYIDPLITKHHIHHSREFWQLIETFLLTDGNRKIVIFAIRKVLKFLSTTEENILVENYFNWPGEGLLASWQTYLTILENLKENQSHLILPSLKMLEAVHLGDDTPWIRIVFQQMLRHKNNLVLRWSVNYLRNFSKLILEKNILEDFFYATNNAWLYTEDRNFQLPPFKIEEQDHFVTVFAQIPWKSIPMHAWLMEMKQRVVWNDVNCKTIISAASRIRQLQSFIIRHSCREFVFSIFKSTIERMDLNDFMNFLDACYSSSDNLTPEVLSLLLFKIEEHSSPFVSLNVFTMLSKEELSRTHQVIILEKLQTFRLSAHKWFSILVVFFFDNFPFKRAFCQENYEIDLEEDSGSLPMKMSEFVKKLSWDDISKAVVRKLTVDWYTTKCGKIKESDFEDLLHTGGMTTLLNIVNPARRDFPLSKTMLTSVIAELKNMTKRMVDTPELVEYIIESCKNDQPNLFYQYLNEILDIDITNNQLAINVFKTCFSKCDFEKSDGRALLIRGLLFGEPLTGDARLEVDYVLRIPVPNLHLSSTNRIRAICLRHLEILDPESMKLLKLELMELSKNMSIRKPRYFENSKHHRLKLRIAQALTKLNNASNRTWHDYYLHAILHENNQTDVTYIFEFLAATTISEEEIFNQMKNLSELSTSCQSSLIAISFLFVVHNKCDSEIVIKLIKLLFPWTMGSNFNTRLHAQMAIYHLIKRFKIDKFYYLHVAIEKSLKKSPNALEKFKTDVRFNFIADPILYVTALPGDVYVSSKLDYFNFFDSMKEARRLQLLKKKPNKEQETNSVIGDVQRKMNPEMDSCGLSSTNEREGQHRDMIVVASLIDKLPNLGGIARTCEVLGIKELVLDSAKHAQNKEFKNLSMTAENWINITEVKPNGLHEFLLTKQVEGYEIVGAEQTSNSVNFMEFKFPRKCVLVLGHEKEGIPADLIALLNHAVEIPQFGMVRSLNVHVTGALFMYEYCKQRLADIK